MSIDVPGEVTLVGIAFGEHDHGGGLSLADAHKWIEGFTRWLVDNNVPVGRVEVDPSQCGKVIHLPAEHKLWLEAHPVPLRMQILGPGPW